MSLATRCSACGTMFRVVQDQLRVSEGWVRCGRCDNVFNALEGLVDLEAEGVQPAAAHQDTGANESVADAPVAPADIGPDHDVQHAMPPAGPPSARLDEPWDEPGEVPAGQDASGEASAIATAALRQPSGAGSQDTAGPDDPLNAVPAVLHAAPARAADLAPTPRFMRQAERDARWTSPAMRAALAGTAVMLLALLLVQAVYHFRDDVAARSATADQLLRSACERWACRIEPPRHLQDVTLESHALLRIAQQPKAVRLAINLRNRGRTEMAVPAVDLSLTDAGGQLIARRTLLPADFRITVPVIARGAELPLEVVLSAGEQNIVGYTVELFYP